ncbi:MAG: type IV pilus assembly protein PilM [Verrucomicrobiota bacterium]
MARATKIISIDIGSSSLKMAEFSTPKSGQILLNRYGITELGIDPNKEENALPYIANAIKKLSKETGIKGGNAHISFSSHTSFLKFIKIPPVEQAQLQDILKFEAQQNVPFPLEEVVWDFQLLMGKKAEGDIDTVLAAIKNDQIESHAANLKKLGISAVDVDLSPLAIYNAFRYNYPESTDCVLLLDIGARGTNLLFIEKNNFFTRSIPLAGNAITQSVCNDLQEPYETVEQLKKSKSYVSLGSEYAESSEENVARTARIVRTTMTKLTQEISRSITFYRTQQKGASPKTIYLTGGSSLLPYIDAFLQDKLNVPVEYFNCLKNVSIGKGVPTAKLSKDALMMGELVGGALSLLPEKPIDINLAPTSIRAEIEQSRLKPILGVALVAWILLFVAINAGYLIQLSRVGAELETRGKKAVQLKEEEQKISKLEDEFSRYQKSLEVLQKIARDRDAWKKVLSDLNSKIPEGVWITQMTPMFNDGKGTHELNEEVLIEQKAAPQKGKKPKGKTAKVTVEPAKASFPPEINQIVIKGLYKSDQRPTVINEFVQELASSPYFDIDTHRLSDAIVSVENVSENNQSLALNFNLNLKLKIPIEVKP